MPSNLHETVAQVLETTGGNVQATALRLGVSEEYARQVKASLPEAPLVPTNGDGKPDLLTQFQEALIPQNADAIVKLRDSVLTSLQAKADANQIPTPFQIRLLRLFLEYETGLMAIARPALNLKVDQRSQSLNLVQMVNQLDGQDTNSLREIVDVEAKPA